MSESTAFLPVIPSSPAQNTSIVLLVTLLLPINPSVWNHAAHTSSGISDVPLSAGDQMNVSMSNRLARDITTIGTNIETRNAQIFGFDSCLKHPNQLIGI